MTYNTFTLSIDLGNAAFDPDPRPEIARILDDVRIRVERGWEEGHINDVNGQLVGAWTMVDPDQPTSSDILQHIEAGIQKYL